MAAPPPRCPGCGSSNIVQDDLYAQAQMVCVDCGAVVSEGSLADEHVEGSGVNFVVARNSPKRLCPNLIKGLQRVKAICQTLRVHAGLESLSVSHFKQAYQHQSFINVTLPKKEILAGCCVLVCCRQLNWPVTMGTISYLVGAEVDEVGAVYQEMIRILNVTSPTVCVTDVMASHCQEYKISSLHVPEELAENPAELTKRAVSLVELAADSWIVTGRRPVPIMMAAVYLSWQSLRPTKLRLKSTLDKFCQMAKVSKQTPAMKRIAEMKAMLCKLANEIPWLTGAVTASNVVVHLEDILKHRSFLLSRALRANEEALLKDSQKIYEEFLSEDVASSQTCEPQTLNSPSLDESEANDKRAAESNWGKRLLFAPPCVMNAKRRRTQRPEVEDVTGDEEISDTEIDSYLRTPQEVKDFARTQKMLSDSGGKTA